MKWAHYLHNRQKIVLSLILAICISLKTMQIHQLKYTDSTLKRGSNVVQIEELQHHLTKHVISPHDFQYLINPQSVCEDEPNLWMLMYVHSAPNNYQQRQLIRQTWAHPTYLAKLPDERVIRLVFMLGWPGSDVIQESLLKESHQYGDIVQEDFTDSYRNLTLKAIISMRWVSTYCKHVTFVLKSDDDVVVNMLSLVPYLDTIQNNHSNHSAQSLLLGAVRYDAPVGRDSRDKWYVARDEFADAHFPPYCKGAAYIMSPDIMRRLYEVSLETPYFWVDDVFVTGILAQKLNIKHIQMYEYYNFAITDEKHVKKKKNPIFALVLHSEKSFMHWWAVALEDF